MVYDQVFRYYEPQKTKSKTVITNFVSPVDSASIPPLKDCMIACSNKDFELLITPDNEIEASLKNGAS